MAQLQTERREFQRLALDTPIAARLGSLEVRIVELGITGARVESARPLTPPLPSELHFASPRGAIALHCDIAHSAGSSAGLRFASAPNDSIENLRRMLADLVTAAIERLRPTGAARADSRGFDPEQTGMRIPVPYISLRLENGAWRKRGAFIPIQPEAGFTVPATENAEELTRLSEEFERAGDEGRRLIRLFAELRVCEALRVPSRV